MSSRTWHRFGLGALLVLTVLATGAAAGDETPEIDDGIDVYFRDADLNALADQDVAKYPDAEAGESKTFERAFPDAPPQVPHTVEDMLPIATDDNECLECHHPENAIGKEDVPLPESHFKRAVMGKGKSGEAMVWVVKGYEKGDDVSGARYSCSMCHTPQATNARTLPSDFVTVKPPKTD